MLSKLPKILSSITQNKITLILVIGLIILIFGGAVFAYQNIFNKEKSNVILQEVELKFDPEGPYAILLPRRDGNAISLQLKRVASYESFAYQISYSDEQGIDRGAGDLNTWIDIESGKGEFEQEVLFGTCSKGDTADPLHCVFDKGVEFGTLILRFRKDDIAYKMTTTWHLQKPDIALGKITSGDQHFNYSTDASRQDLQLVGFSIVNDLSGAPKLSEGKEILGKVYAFNVPIAKDFPNGSVGIELVDNPSGDAKIAYFDEGANAWVEMETKIDGSKLTSKGEGAGIYTVLTTKAQ